MIRPAVDDDSQALIALIASVYAEYEGCILDVERECPELLSPATAFREWSGGLWVAEIGGRIAGSLGFVPSGNGVELRKVYVAAAHRRLGIARSLYRHSLACILEQGAQFIELWSDTRFEAGHKFYEKLGFTRKSWRMLNDASNSIENHFSLDLQPRLFELNANGIARRLPEFTDLLEDSVLHGASVGFVPPIEPGELDAYWNEVIAAVGSGSRVLLVAQIGDVVIGSVQLALESRRNGRHRAEVMKLLVHSTAHRRGVASALMRACETRARAKERKLLVLDTAVGHPAEQLYEKLGYARAGVIPRYATSRNGDIDTVFMYKELT